MGGAGDLHGIPVVVFEFVGPADDSKTSLFPGSASLVDALSGICEERDALFLRRLSFGEPRNQTEARQGEVLRLVNDDVVELFCLTERFLIQ